uniref:Uncharacterized protein n=1 Tax=viral metagenome TaxID=1070528 RepID=A0A6M3L5Y9_9ZZZZ
MNKLKQLWNLLKGKKTYIVAALMIILGLINQDNTMVLEGLAFAGLRLGIK